jgi:hypothetical protein
LGQRGDGKCGDIEGVLEVEKRIGELHEMKEDAFVEF